MSEPNVQREDNPHPQGEGEPEHFDVVADDDDVMPALETLPGGDDDGTERDLNETFTARLQEIERDYQERLERTLRELELAAMADCSRVGVYSPFEALILRTARLRYSLLFLQSVELLLIVEVSRVSFVVGREKGEELG